ncbi:DUF5667 domain-containing protein [Chloroflexota bacterium]
MSKSREFDNVLNECLERLLFKGETIEQCLGSFPEHTGELKPLLETAVATKKASAILPRPEFRDKARYQFHLALQETERKKNRPFFSWGWQPQWATVVVIALVLLLAGGGTVSAASGSMPGALLYPVKLATEQARLILTPSAIGKAELYARLANERVLEIVRMATENKPQQIEQTAQRLDVYLTKIAVLTSTHEVTSGVAMAPAVEEAEMLREAPVAEKAMAVEKALTSEEALSFEEAPAAKEVPGAGRPNAPPVIVDRRASLKATVERNATIHTASLRALLETVPESARPALLRAIAVSETGYEKALESLDEPQ